MINQRIYLIGLLYCFFIEMSLASTNIRFNHLRIEDGLPAKMATAFTQDKDGFIWIGTSNGITQFDGHQLSSFPKRPRKSKKQAANIDGSDYKKNTYITSLKVDHSNQLWIGSLENGIYIYQLNTGSFIELEQFEGFSKAIHNSRVFDIDFDQFGNTWIGSDAGLFKVNTNNKFIEIFKNDGFHFEVFGSNVIKSVLAMENNRVYLAVEDNLIVFNTNSHRADKVHFANASINSLINTLEYSLDQTIWIGTQAGLLQYNPLSNVLTSHLDKVNDAVRHIVQASDQRIWVGTLLSGLYLFEKNEISEHYQYSKGDAFSLGDNSVWSLFQDNSGVVWVGTFNAGAHFFDPLTLQFGLKLDDEMGIPCLTSRVIYSILEDINDTLWIGSANGLTQWNQSKNQCQSFTNKAGQVNSIPKSAVLSLLRSKDGRLWVGSGVGLRYLDEKTNTFHATNSILDRLMINDLYEEADGHLWVLTYRGVYRLSPTRQNIELVKVSNKRLDKASFYSLVSDFKGDFWFGSENGLAKFNKLTKVIDYLRLDQQFVIREKVGALHIDKQGFLWAGVNKKGLYKIDLSNGQFSLLTEEDGLSTIDYFAAISSDRSNYLWVATSKGISKVDVENIKVTKFHQKDGLQSESFTKGAFARLKNGDFAFGGRQGLNIFTPEIIRKNSYVPQTKLTKILYFNKEVEFEAEDEFSLSKPLRKLEQLELTYKDYIIGFEFASLHYSSPKDNQFAYKMEGLEREWNKVDANNRRTTYTNLSPGDYTFRVKSSSKDAIWDDKGVELKIKVYPAPWRTWWAYSLYVLLLILIMLCVILIQSRAARRRALFLEGEIEKHTLELVKKNNTIELLLKHKNKIFANISHEFRTPLTLILGPIEKVRALISNELVSDSLSMVQRNAERLLSLVDQLLKLSEVYQEEPLKKANYSLTSKVEFTLNSFLTIAEAKNIQLMLTTDSDYVIHTTEDALETIVGNLVSNAIKYSPVNSSVNVSVVGDGKNVTIKVLDQGAGIPADLKEKIFSRFIRMNKHREIQGTGLGLSLVKEVAEINSGKVCVESQEGKGSCFSVTFPLVSKTDVECYERQWLKTKPLTFLKNEREVNIRVDQGECDDEAICLPDLSEESTLEPETERGTLLIIEDNEDMRVFIRSALEADYNCITASDGEQGVSLAFEMVPDVIVSDIMMPKLDGFEVCRQVRADERTSHIPFILLTARHDIESQMIGWKEDVDDYLTKPFDSKELLIRIKRIESIRNILKRKYSKSAMSTSDEHRLPFKEEQFINKLNDVIESNFREPEFGRTQLAEKMAVSERQLQRKLKALINFNPSDYLREYRLNQAALKISEGFQIGLIAEQCGFTSPAHFSRCFKAQYGVTPKAFQNKNLTV